VGVKKTFKKAKKKARNTYEDAEDAVRSVKKEVNEVTGAIDGFLDEAVDISMNDVGNAYRYARKQLDEAADTLARLAEQAVEAAYREVYDRYIEGHGKLITGLVEAETKIISGNTSNNLFTKIRDALLAGRFSDVESSLVDLTEHEAVQPVMADARKVMGTCLVVAADLSFGGSYNHVSLGGTGMIGAAFSLGDDDVLASVFTTAGGAVGLTTSGGTSIQQGWIIGFLAKDPLNISGVFVDVAGQLGHASRIIGPCFGFPPPSSHPPYVTAKPTVISGRYATDYGGLPPPYPTASVSIGGSYTWILQKIKA
jgi:hypothetical protein